MDAQQQGQLRLLLQMLQTALNKVRQNHEDRPLVEVEAGISAADLEVAIVAMLEADVPAEVIKERCRRIWGSLKSPYHRAFLSYWSEEVTDFFTKNN